MSQNDLASAPNRALPAEDHLARNPISHNNDLIGNCHELEQQIINGKHIERAYLITPQGQCVPQLGRGPHRKGQPLCICGRHKYCISPRVRNHGHCHEHPESLTLAILDALPKVHSHNTDKSDIAEGFSVEGQLSQENSATSKQALPESNILDLDPSQQVEHYINYYMAPCAGKSKVDTSNLVMHKGIRANGSRRTHDAAAHKARRQIIAELKSKKKRSSKTQGTIAHSYHLISHPQLGDFKGRNSILKYSPLPGFATIDFVTRQVYLDPHVAYMLGLTWSDQGISYDEFTEHFPERTQIDLEHFELGRLTYCDTVGYRFTLASGPMQGNTYEVNIGTMLRANNGHAIYAMAYFTYSSADFTSEMPQSLSGDGTWECDGVTGKLTFTPQYLSMLGYSEDEYFPDYIDKWIEEALHPDDIEMITDMYRKIMNSQDNGDYFECCMRIKHKDGSYIWVLARGMVIGRSNDGHGIHITGTNTNLQQVKERTDSVKALSFKDNLTGLYNRRYLNAKKPTYIDDSNQPLFCLYADVTGLKLINDYVSHEQGNTLLTTVTEILRTAFRLPCDLFRLGGDEFLMILPQAKKAHLHMLTSNIDILTRVASEQGDMPIFVGYGIASLTEANNDFDEMIALADRRAQEQKAANYERNYEAIYAYLSKCLGRTVNAANITDARRLDIDLETNE